MNKKKSLDKIGGLLEKVAAKSVPFLDQCSETKLLAYSDIGEAHEKYRVLAKQAFAGSEDILSSRPNCRHGIKSVQSALKRKNLSPDLVTALSELRTSYLEEILRPAVRGYLSNGKAGRVNIEDLYEKVFRLDGLIEVGQFFKRVDSL
jgi:hypothetical protein